MGFAKEGSCRGALLGACVVMPDHLHAFIALDDQKIALAARMKSSKKYALEDVAPQWNCGTALAKRFLRSCTSKARSRRRRIGIMCGRIRSALDWSRVGRIGHFEAKSLIWRLQIPRLLEGELPRALP